MSFNESEIALMKERLLKSVNEFLENDFEKIVRCEKFNKDPHKFENVYNRALDAFTKSVKKSDKYGKFRNVRNCEVFLNQKTFLEMCPHGGTSRMVGSRQKFYCNRHEEQRQQEWRRYHCFNYDEYKRNGFQKTLRVQLQAAKSHYRRIKYREKYNIETDINHSTFEASLNTIYKDRFKLNPITKKMNYVSTDFFIIILLLIFPLNFKK